MRSCKVVPHRLTSSSLHEMLPYRQPHAVHRQATPAGCVTLLAARHFYESFLVFLLFFPFFHSTVTYLFFTTLSFLVCFLSYLLSSIS
jgi:hypothetical protein